MPHYRIRRAGIEFPVSGLPALEQMVGDGALAGEDRVWDPGVGSWRPASEIEALAEAFVLRAALLERLPPPRAPAFPHVATPPVEPPVVESPLGSAPPPSPAPDDAAALPPEEEPPPDPPESLGQVIHFPAPVRGPDDALARQALPEAFDTALFRPAEVPGARPSPWRVRPMVVVSTFLLGGALLLAVEMHVRGTADRYFQPVQASRTIPTVVPGAPPTASPPNLPAGMADFYDTMEDELRSRMVTGEFEVRSDDALEMALMVELSRLRVDLVRANAPILEWGGRRGDVPLRAEIRIWFESQPADLDRELAAVGLVIGRYVQRFSLDVSVFEILIQDPDGTIRTRSLDPELARAFYLQRISLLKYLAGDEAP